MAAQGWKQKSNNVRSAHVMVSAGRLMISSHSREEQSHCVYLDLCSHKKKRAGTFHSASLYAVSHIPQFMESYVLRCLTSTHPMIFPASGYGSSSSKPGAISNNARPPVTFST